MNRNYLLYVLKQRGIINPNDTLNVRFSKKLFETPKLLQSVINATSFLTGSACIKTRLHVLLQGIKEQPTCSACGQDVFMRLNGKYRYTFPTYCSTKCSSSAREVIEKRQKTNTKKYGHSNVLVSEYGKKKSAKTNLEKYGIENPGALPTFIEKRKQTCVERYGVETPITSPQFIEKRKQTCIEKYGVENPGALPTVIEKRKQTCVERYGVDNPFKLQEIQTKADQTMLERYGVKSPIMLDSFKDKITETMVTRYGHSHFHTSQISPNVQEILDDKYWLLRQHHELKNTIQKIALTLGVSDQMVRNKFKHYNIEIISHNNSQVERDVLQFVESVYTGKIITNTREIVPPKEIDIYLPEINIAFEINGVFWHSETQGKCSNYHLNKTKECERRGVRLIHILDKEWNTTPRIVKSRILSTLGLNKTIPARKTTGRKITSKQAAEFFKANHIQGAAGAKVCYGLFHEDTLVAAMSFGKPRYNKHAEWELIRSANLVDTNVVGGGSKLFKMFVRECQPNTIVSYSDKRWNTGRLYEKLGFTHAKSTRPNYYYFSPTNTNILYHRSYFQKHKLKNKLPIFDPLLTEWENMINNGYDRIWDCGNDVFFWEQ
jgi:hypothetical protein